MMKAFKNLNDRFALSALAPALLVTALMFGPLISSPNHFLLSLGGDGFKNYFTYLYFIKYDYGCTFTGMGYPFGEHMVFTDNMPAIAWTVAQLRLLFPNVYNYGLGVMHVAMLISFPLCSVFLYKIHRLFHTGIVWSSISAVFITFFSPQLLRFTGHFALSFVCVIPMILYWLMCFESKKRIKYLIYISCFALFTGFLHVYNLGFCLVLTGAYSIARMVQYSIPLKHRISSVLPPLISAIIPVASFKVFLFFTDPVRDRPQFPPGILSYCTKMENLITSSWAPLGFTFQFLVGGKASSGGEGYVYVGFISLITLFAFILLICKNLLLKIKKGKPFNHPVRKYRTWMITAFICLILAMGIPFKWGLEWLLDHISSFRQMRSLGRFSWGFYYIMMIFVSIWIFQYYRYLIRKRKIWLGKSLLASVTIIWMVQLSGYVTMMRTAIRDAEGNYEEYVKKEDEWQEWLSKHHLPLKNFQASIGLPFFYIGADKTEISADNTGYILYQLATLGICAELPIVDVMMSRASWSRAFQISRMLDGPLTDFPYIDSFDNRPVLLLVNERSPLTIHEQQIVAGASFIDSFSDNKIYSLEIRKLLERNKKIQDSVMSRVSYDTRAEGLLNDTGFYYAQHFDGYQHANIFAGTGALGKVADLSVIASFSVPVQNHDRDYVFSAWSLCDSLNDHLTVFRISQYNEQHEKIDEADAFTGRSTRVEHFWFKTESVLSVKAATTKIEIAATGYHNKDNHIAIDELILWPLGSTYFYKPQGSTTIYINNRPFQKSL